jgi:glycosyltransferase involved in cell wall biosynthesis
MNTSVLITCYNEEEYIGEAIESVVQQSCYDAIIEIIVVNDGSEDNSEEVIQEWKDRCDKLHYVYQENQGLPGARNTGIERCSGDFIALLDGDDLWLKKRLERQLNFVENHPDVGLVYSDFYVFGEGIGDRRERRYCNQYEKGDDDVLRHFFVHGGPMIPSTTLINRDCFRTVGHFDPAFLRGQDTDMWLRIAGEYPIHHVNEPLVLKRQRDDSLGANVEEKAHYVLKVHEKIVGLYPELAPLKKKRDAKKYGDVARHLVISGKRTRGLKAALQSVYYDPLAIKQYLTLLFAISPISSYYLKEILEYLKSIKK